ncbi:hypothetical protein ACL9RI_00295 [Janthinobacterium sp. Mn2066]|uniref:hypothetical protein n=1 Tax=Janthinobacterium sp. Mn2066 TaxID=3395264 RepID=UPI003BEBE636
MMNLQWKAEDETALAGRWPPFYPIALLWRPWPAPGRKLSLFTQPGVVGNAVIA